MDNNNFEELYEQCSALCPEMQFVIEYIRNIPAKCNEIGSTIKKLKSGDKSAIKRFIELYLKTALNFSLQAAKKSGLPLDELFSEAVSVITKRAEDQANHKISKGNTISAEIKNGLQRYISKQENLLSYEPIDLGGSYHIGKSMLKELCMPELHELISEAMFNLPEKYEIVLSMRYGINNVQYTVSEIAEILGLSKQGVYMREKIALKKLRESRIYSEQLKQYLADLLNMI